METEPAAGTENVPESTLSQEARRLVAAGRRGVLSALIPRDGYPYGSLVEYAPLPDGDVLLFFSRLAEHQHYISADPRVSLLVAADFSSADALASPRVSLVGKMMLLPKEEELAATDLAAHPQARPYINFGDFQFYRLQVEKARYIAGFGRMGWITAGRYRQAV